MCIRDRTVLGGQTMHHPLANFLGSICAKNCEKLLRVDKVITTNIMCSILAQPVFLHQNGVRVLVVVTVIALARVKSCERQLGTLTSGA